MANDAAVSTIYGFPTKYVSLIVLVVQNSALVLTMRYSRILPGPRYLSSTAVVISECLKCLICFGVYIYEQLSTPHNSDLPLLSDQQSNNPPFRISQMWTDIFSVKSGFPKLLIPAVLYTLQNNLQFVAASNLDAATFQVTYQCKILTTALFAVMLLRQSLSPRKWLSLFILTLGVACVQIPSGAAVIQHEGNYFVGIVAVAIACVCSGFAGVYFEKVLKNGNNTSIWVRNIQLSVGCLAIAVMGTLVWDGKAIQQRGFFQGYNHVVIFTICIQAAGGLIVAMVIKYADNILKGFATSLSIILSTVASVFIFNFIITIYFLIGTVFVFLATYMYSMPDVPKVVGDANSKSEEATPMLVVEDYDERRERLSNEKQSFRDESDLESGDDHRSDSGSDHFEPRSGRRNFSPSMLQNNRFERRDSKVDEQLGHVH